jgi:hypothetical protein
MASTFDRGRHPDSLRGEQLGETADPTRVTVPLSEAFLLSSLTGSIIRAACEHNLIDYIFDRLNDGTVDKVEKTVVDEDGFELDVQVDGKWYHISVHFSPTGEYSA